MIHIYGNCILIHFSEAENGEVWYYSSPQQLQELMDVLDADEMETPLVRELLEMKQEILRQMTITEKLTNQAKGNRKSYLEIENANILKQKKLRQEQRQQDQNIGLRIEDEKEINDSTLVPDGDVENEVTVTTEDPLVDYDDNDINNDDEYKRKNNAANKFKTSTQKKLKKVSINLTRAFRLISLIYKLQIEKLSFVL